MKLTRPMIGGRITNLLGALAVAVALLPVVPTAAASGGSSTQPAPERIEFSLLDSDIKIEAPIGQSGLTLAVTYSRSWGEVAVFDRRKSGPARNLLYHSASWRGPYPTQIAASHKAAGLFDDLRVLPVHGHAYQIVLTLKEVRLVGQGSAAQFAAGDVTIEWRASDSIVRAKDEREDQEARYDEIESLIKKNLHWTAHFVRAVDSRTIRDVRVHIVPADIPVLIRMLADSENKIRVAASGLLATQGERAVSALLEAVASDSSIVSEGASQALQRIEECKVQDGTFRNADLCPEQ